MLNYETLLSSYDDKLTLMQWLKKVEEALKDASATSFDVIKTGNATLKFAITFEDGTSLVSGEIVLQQGESVASGEIRNGHLFLTLTNGQELDCGLLFNGDVTLTGNLMLTGNLTALGVHATGTGIETSVLSQESSSGIDVFADIVTLNNDLRAQGTIAANKLKQSVANESYGFAYAGTSSLDITNNYCNAVVINGVLYIIFNITEENISGASLTVYGHNTPINLSEDVAEKIYDINGNSAAEAGNNALITAIVPYVESYNGTAHKPVLKILNTNTPNQIRVDINWSEGSGETWPAGEKLFACGRIALTLL